MKTTICIFLILLFSTRLFAQTVSISGSNIVCSGTSDLFTATGAAVSAPHYIWTVNGIHTGSDNPMFNLVPNNGDSIVCLLANSTGDSVYDTSNSIIVTVLNQPNSGIITAPDTNVCVGATITLSDAAPGGLWIVSNNCASISNGGVVTGLHTGYEFEGNIMPGLDTVYYVVTNTCGTDTATIHIYVISLPDPYLDIPDGICVGQGYVLDEGQFGIATSEYGHVSCSGTYISAISVGQDYIINIATNSCGSDTMREPIYVMPTSYTLPIVASRSEVCVGDTILLQDSSAGGYPYWRSSENNVAIVPVTAANPSKVFVTGLRSGAVTIDISVAGQCGSANASTIITVNPPEVITGIDSVCVTQAITLADNTNGGIWSIDNKQVATITDKGVVTGLAAGIDTVAYTLANGCVVKSAVTVNALPGPISGDDIACNGLNVTFTNDSTNGIWTSSNSSIAKPNPFTQGVFIAKYSGIAIIQYTLPTGCTATKQLTVLNCKAEVDVFPSPFKNKLFIIVDTILYDRYTVTNSWGQKMSEGNLSQTLTEIDTELWRPGMYIVFFSGEGLTYTVKLIRE